MVIPISYGWQTVLQSSATFTSQVIYQKAVMSSVFSVSAMHIGLNEISDAAHFYTALQFVTCM
jgi:hypothetical protein